MSFGDLSRGGGARSSGTRVSTRDPIAQLSDSLQSFQRECISVKESITAMRRRKVGPVEKNDLDIRIRSIRETESRLRNQIDSQMQALEKLPRQDAMVKRAALGKLQKDFDRIKVNVQALSSEATLIKVSHELAGKEKFVRVGGGGSGRINTSGTIGGSSNDTLPVPPSQQQQQLQQQQTGPPIMNLMQDQEIDAAIMEERERDIKKLNQDIRLVNEMFQDMAQIVDRQGSHVEEIAKATDTSHDRAKAGLDQVKQAAAYQPTCTIS